MIQEAAMVMVSSVLFIRMGLSGEMQRFLGIRSKVMSCPKCLTFWTALATLILGRHPFLQAIALSFISSYSAMWLSLLVDAGTVKYNSLYGKITETNDTSEASAETCPAVAGEDSLEADTADEVS